MNKRPKKIHLSSYVFIGCIIAICSACASNRTSAQTKIRHFTLNTIFPMGVYQGAVIYDTSRVQLYEWEENFLHESPIKRNESRIQIDKDGNQVGDTLIALPDSKYYLFYSAKDQIGVFYNSFKTPNTWYGSVDSFLKTKSITCLADFLDKELIKDSLVSTLKMNDDAVLMEKYIPKIKMQGAYDTMILRYSKMPSEIAFSFSPKLDSLRQTKLIRVELKFNGLPDSPDESFRLARMAILEFHEMPIADLEKKITLFKRMDSIRSSYSIR